MFCSRHTLRARVVATAALPSRAHSPSRLQRERLHEYGLSADAFESLKARVHAEMETPGCRLRIYWRSFWASCGDPQRFEWRNGPQAAAT